ncbi:MAG: PH domain-containing protein [Verrucomicrobiota bacterium]
MKTYSAPWSRVLLLTSSSGALVCFGAGMITMLYTPLPLRWLGLALASVPLVCALFSIRHYSVSPDLILIHRLFWKTAIPRAGLKDARFDPQAMQRSVRTCGNGGLFSFTGSYWNKVLGQYRAYVTDPSRAVVLSYSSGKTVVLSPGQPEAFVRELRVADLVAA